VVKDFEIEPIANFVSVVTGSGFPSSLTPNAFA